MDMTNQDYGKLVNQYSQSSPLGKNMVWAFLVGGAICTAGQGPPRSKKFSFLISPSFSWIIRRHLHNFFDAPYNAPGPFSWKEAYPCFIPKS